MDEEITIEGLSLDLKASIEALQNLGIDKETIKIFAYSLGVPIGLKVASEYGLECIGDRPFTTSEVAAYDEAPFGTKVIAKKIFSDFFHLSTIDPLKKFKGKKVTIILGDKELGYKKEFKKALKSLESDHKLLVIPTLEHMDVRVHEEVKRILLNDKEE